MAVVYNSKEDIDEFFARSDAIAIRHKAWQWFIDRMPNRCGRCGSDEGVELEDSRTMYEWDGTGLDPNRPRRLCRPCAKEHHEYWDEMWSHVHDGVFDVDSCIRDYRKGQ